MDFSNWLSTDLGGFISSHKFEGLMILLVVAVIFRKKIMSVFRKKQKGGQKVDYSSMMSNGESFDATFDFNKTIASEKNLYEKRLEQIDEELKSIKLELARLEEEYLKRKGTLEEEYSTKKDMIMHQERQLVLQYNTFIKNLNNLNAMSKEHEAIEKSEGPLQSG